MREISIKLFLTAALMINILVILFRYPLSRILNEIVIKKDNSAIFFITGIDEILSKISPNGDIFLYFNGFKSEVGQSWGTPGDAASIIYFRTAYTMYPYKVYTGDKGMKIVRGTEFLNSGFTPNKTWLREMKITGILSFSRSDKGSIFWNYEKVKVE